NSLRDRVSVSEVVLVALPERFGISGRYLLYVMAERTELASHIVRRHASFDSDQAPRHIGEPGRDPAAGNLLPQNDCPLVVVADQMQGVLACIDANGVSDVSGCLMGHRDVLLWLQSPRSSSGRGARPVHPIRVPSYLIFRVLLLGQSGRE